MASSLRIHPLVAVDLSEAAAHYDGISLDLGNRFRAAARERISTIRERPESYGVILNALRAARFNRFPYVMVFEHDETVTHLLGVFHAASDQEKWSARSG